MNKYLTKLAAIVRTPVPLSGVSEGVIGYVGGAGLGAIAGHLYDKKKHGKKYDARKHNTGMNVGAGVGGLAGAVGAYKLNKREMVIDTSTGAGHSEKTKMQLHTDKFKKTIDDFKRKHKMRSKGIGLASSTDHGTAMLHRLRSGKKFVKPIFKVVK